jgi:hypothetical protein
MVNSQRLDTDSGLLSKDAVETQPLDQKLDTNVRKYQEQLFEAREVNAKERRDAPERVAEVRPNSSARSRQQSEANPLLSSRFCTGCEADARIRS